MKDMIIKCCACTFTVAKTQRLNFGLDVGNRYVCGTCHTDIQKWLLDQWLNSKNTKENS